jgi:hypothetical protein
VELINSNIMNPSPSKENQSPKKKSNPKTTKREIFYVQVYIILFLFLLEHQEKAKP